MYSGEVFTSKPFIGPLLQSSVGRSTSNTGSLSNHILEDFRNRNWTVEKPREHKYASQGPGKIKQVGWRVLFVKKKTHNLNCMLKTKLDQKKCSVTHNANDCNVPIY